MKASDFTIHLTIAAHYMISISLELDKMIYDNVFFLFFFFVLHFQFCLFFVWIFFICVSPISLCVCAVWRYLVFLFLFISPSARCFIYLLISHSSSVAWYVYAMRDDLLLEDRIWKKKKNHLHTMYTALILLHFHSILFLCGYMSEDCPQCNNVIIFVIRSRSVV